MEQKPGLLGWLHHLIAPRRRQPPSLNRVEAVLEEKIRQLQAVDPDTRRQWERLKIAIDARDGSVRARPFSVRFRQVKPALAFALAVAVFVAGGVIWLNQGWGLKYETTKGQQSTIRLSDSTEVTLNHTSALVVHRRPFERARHVTLTGEAYFRVKKNGTPFTVSTDVATVEVLGTEFNVRVREGRVEVAVVRGSVKVHTKRGGGDSSVVLTSGQLLACTAQEYPGTPVPIPFADYPGWRQGKFMFYRLPLRSACSEIEQQFDVVITIENPKAPDATITGVLDGKSAEGALRTLSILMGTTYRHENGSYFLY